MLDKRYLLISMLLVLIPQMVEATAINVPPTARQIADGAIYDAKLAVEQAKAKELWQQYLANDEKKVSDVKEFIALTQKRLADARAFYEKTDQDLTMVTASGQANLDDFISSRDKAREQVALLEKYLLDAESDLAGAEKTRDKTGKSLESMDKASLSDRSWQGAGADIKYYRWHSDEGDRGYQLYMPAVYTFIDGHMEYSFKTAYMYSNNKTGIDNGKYTGWTDSNLGVAYNSKHGKYQTIYSLNVNLPTGKSNLYGNNAIMTDDLVEMSRFGEGWNYIPAILFNWEARPGETWALGASYTRTGSYDYDSSRPDGWIDPANNWTFLGRFKKIKENWQFVGEVQYSTYSKTIEAASEYRQGDQFEVHLVYNRKLANRQNLMFYYWYNNEQPYDSFDPTLPKVATGRNHYAGTRWKNDVSAKGTVGIGFDFMRKFGSVYDPLTDLRSNGRTKYTVGLDYEHRINTKTKLTLRAEQFYMKDNQAGSSGYHGYNFYGTCFFYI